MKHNITDETPCHTPEEIKAWGKHGYPAANVSIAGGALVSPGKCDKCGQWLPSDFDVMSQKKER